MKVKWRHFQRKTRGNSHQQTSLLSWFLSLPRIIINKISDDRIMEVVSLILVLQDSTTAVRPRNWCVFWASINLFAWGSTSGWWLREPGGLIHPGMLISGDVSWPGSVQVLILLDRHLSSIDSIAWSTWSFSIRLVARLVCLYCSALRREGRNCKHVYL